MVCKYINERRYVFIAQKEGKEHNRKKKIEKKAGE